MWEYAIVKVHIFLSKDWKIVSDNKSIIKAEAISVGATLYTSIHFVYDYYRLIYFKMWIQYIC